MMPGAPVAEAVFADLEPRIKKLRERGHAPGLGDDPRRRATPRARATSGMKQREGRGARLQLAAHPPARRRDPGRRRSPRSASFNDDPAVDGYPRPAPDAAADRLRGRAARDRPGQGRRRPAPGEPRPARAVDAGPGAVHAGRDRGAARALRDPGRRAARSCILGRGTTLGRPLAMLLSQKRPTANAAVTVVHTGVPDWPRLHAAGRRSWSPRPACPGSSSPSTSRRARSSSAAACATRARSCCPTSTRRCEEVAGCDHAARRRRRPDDDRDAVPQRWSRRRARARGRGRGADDASSCPLCARAEHVDDVRCPECNVDRRVRPGSPEPVRGRDAVGHDGAAIAVGVRRHAARGGAHRLTPDRTDRRPPAPVARDAERETTMPEKITLTPPASCTSPTSRSSRSSRVTAPASTSGPPRSS